MIKKILVTPREDAEYVAKKDTAFEGLAIISICSQKEDILFNEDVKKRIGCEVLNMVFADLTADDYKISPGLISKFPAFNKKMARETISFLDNLKDKDIEILLIHCDAGVSRSAAVGVFACRYLGMNEKEFRKENRVLSPNSLVYDILYKESGLRGNYKKWWENIPIDPKIRAMFID